MVNVSAQGAYTVWRNNHVHFLRLRACTRRYFTLQCVYLALCGPHNAFKINNDGLVQTAFGKSFSFSDF
eukprot:6085927-Pyramimonas_sp.AAC.1